MHLNPRTRNSRSRIVTKMCPILTSSSRKVSIRWGCCWQLQYPPRGAKESESLIVPWFSSRSLQGLRGGVTSGRHTRVSYVQLPRNVFIRKLASGPKSCAFRPTCITKSPAIDSRGCRCVGFEAVPRSLSAEIPPRNALPGHR
jgi:hypothetical protein